LAFLVLFLPRKKVQEKIAGSLRKMLDMNQRAGFAGKTPST
jgi:hypothetical protein